MIIFGLGIGSVDVSLEEVKMEPFTTYHVASTKGFIQKVWRGTTEFATSSSCFLLQNHRLCHTLSFPPRKFGFPRLQHQEQLRFCMKHWCYAYILTEGNHRVPGRLHHAARAIAQRNKKNFKIWQSPITFSNTAYLCTCPLLVMLYYYFKMSTHIIFREWYSIAAYCWHRAVHTSFTIQTTKC